ncbi:NUDIX hydrolase [Flagellimonas nanhaiensis]|uniref:NUDIX hydrolase n=1 Tax=Flagellimonas nanhaiensis TaxID=2292706 RepID=A0A371JT13_9FLAO|nr:NUDIX domain-containing protein [Allomuricauda nanhaiensis]RDY60934.1 NUDIX hydrolase [Allomuricauda nanhaiensis]
MNVQDVIEHGAEYFLPNLSIDHVIIGYQDDTLKCLLLKVGDKWVLPGGYILQEESVDHAAERILMERTGLKRPHLRFLSVFGNKDRKFDNDFKGFFKKRGLPWREDYWINDRFVTLAYYSLVNIDTTHPVPGEFDDAAEWFSMDELPEMWLDHNSIVDTARERLKGDIAREQVTYNLLPTEFTMPQLHQLHQTILGSKLDRSRFQKKMIATGMFERLPQVVKESPGRNPYQYRLKKEA